MPNLIAGWQTNLKGRLFSRQKWIPNIFLAASHIFWNFRSQKCSLEMYIKMILKVDYSAISGRTLQIRFCCAVGLLESLLIRKFSSLASCLLNWAAVIQTSKGPLSILCQDSHTSWGCHEENPAKLPVSLPLGMTCHISFDYLSVTVDLSLFPFNFRIVYLILFQGESSAQQCLLTWSVGS